METLKVRIGDGGKVKIEADGFTGSSCVDATKAVESALAGRSPTVQRELKAEYHETTPETENVRA